MRCRPAMCFSRTAERAARIVGIGRAAGQRPLPPHPARRVQHVEVRHAVERARHPVEHEPRLDQRHIEAAAVVGAERAVRFRPRLQFAQAPRARARSPAAGTGGRESRCPRSTRSRPGMPACRRRRRARSSRDRETAGVPSDLPLALRERATPWPSAACASSPSVIVETISPIGVRPCSMSARYSRSTTITAPSECSTTAPPSVIARDATDRLEGGGFSPRRSRSRRRLKPSPSKRAYGQPTGTDEPVILDDVAKSIERRHR